VDLPSTALSPVQEEHISQFDGQKKSQSIPLASDMVNRVRRVRPRRHIHSPTDGFPVGDPLMEDGWGALPGPGASVR
jgi:hypothetical protein